MKRILLSIITVATIVTSASAQEKHYRNKGYITTGGNGGILSFADIKEDGDRVNSIPRFTLFFNIGTNYNYDFSENVGFFSGLNIKNIGLITKDGNIKLKRRVYTLGVPIGFKVGNLETGHLFFAGGELDFAFNYKEKRFVNGDKVSKFNEWFSDRTPVVMPSLFAGVQFNRHFSFKAQYYPSNFFNTSFKDDNGVEPYKNTDANILFITIGYHFTPKRYFRHDS
jgi:Outer membrane protein beta-barrel domain